MLATLVLSIALRAQDQGTIEGRITNRITGEPLPDVKVRLTKQGRRRATFESTTDGAGFYRITGLTGGDYMAEFATNGFFSSVGPAKLQVSANAAVERNVRLAPYGSIRGRVLDENGNHAAGIRVELNSAFGVRTDENGEFLFDSLGPELFPLLAKPEPKIRIQDGERISAVPTYYPSTIDPSQAVLVGTHEGQNVSGIEIRLRTVPVYRVSGVVLDPAGKPQARVRVRLLNRNGPVRRSIGGSSCGNPDCPRIDQVIPTWEPEVAWVESQDDGSFQFPAVQSGEWTLSAATSPQMDLALGGVTPVIVSTKDVDDIQVRLSPPMGIEVIEDWGDTKPTISFRNPEELVTFAWQEWQPVLQPQDLTGRTSKLSGLFPGRYVVLPTAHSGDWYVDSITWNGIEVSGQAIDLQANAEPLRVRIKTGTGKVRGIVEGCDGGTVFLEPREASEITDVHSVECRPDGSFDFNGLKPGDYSIAAYHGASDAPIPWSTFPAAMIATASAVRVESRSTASIDLKASPWPW